MIMDLFDRKINVYIYDKEYIELGKVLTPEFGPKPEIKVEGTIISNTYAISSKVTITNIERSIPVEQAKYLYVEMYYGKAQSDAIKKGFIFDVLYADQSKQPPDRQVCFNCVVAGTSPDIMQQTTSIGEVDAEGVPIERTLDSLLREFISDYNIALSKTLKSPEMYKKLALNHAPLYRMSSIFETKYKNHKIPYMCSNKTLANILDDLSASCVEKEHISNTESTEYYALNFYTENKNLVVATNPSYNAEVFVPGISVLNLNYVIAAYRCGPIIHCNALFDPRIHQDATVAISRNAVLGRKASGELVPIQGETLLFRPVGGIKYEFSTTTENSMQMQGVAYAQQE